MSVRKERTKPNGRDLLLLWFSTAASWTRGALLVVAAIAATLIRVIGAFHRKPQGVQTKKIPEREGEDRTRRGIVCVCELVVAETSNVPPAPNFAGLSTNATISGEQQSFCDVLVKLRDFSTS